MDVILSEILILCLLFCLVCVHGVTVKKVPNRTPLLLDRHSNLATVWSANGPIKATDPIIIRSTWSVGSAEPRLCFLLTFMSGLDAVVERNAGNSMVGENAAVRSYVVAWPAGSGVKVFRPQLTASNPVSAIAVSPTINLEKSFVLADVSSSGTVIDDVNGGLLVQLQLAPLPGNQLSYDFGVDAPDGARATVQIVEYPNCFVYRGSAELSSGQQSDSVAISKTVTSVAASKAMLVFHQRVKSDPPSGPVDLTKSWFIAGFFEPVEQKVTFERIGSDLSVDIEWQLVVFTDGTTVSHHQTTFAPGSLLETNDRISVDVDRTIPVIASPISAGRSANTGTSNWGSCYVRLALTKATEIILARRDDTAFCTVHYQLVQFDSTVSPPPPQPTVMQPPPQPSVVPTFDPPNPTPFPTPLPPAFPSASSPTPPHSHSSVSTSATTLSNQLDDSRPIQTPSVGLWATGNNSPAPSGVVHMSGPQPKDNNNATVLAIGASVGGVLVCLVLVILFLVVFRRKQQQAQHQRKQQSHPTAMAAAVSSQVGSSSSPSPSSSHSSGRGKVMSTSRHSSRSSSRSVSRQASRSKLSHQHSSTPPQQRTGRSSLLMARHYGQPPVVVDSPIVYQRAPINQYESFSVPIN